MFNKKNCVCVCASALVSASHLSYPKLQLSMNPNTAEAEKVINKHTHKQIVSSKHV